MPEGCIPLLIGIIILVILSAFFSSTETAYSCASKIKLRSLSTNGNKRAGKVLDLAEEKYDKLISTILVGNNIVNLSAATLSTLFFVELLKNVNVDSSVISTIVITVLVLIFGEITPKFIAKNAPEKMAMLFYPLVMFFYFIFYPFNFIFSGWKWLISKIFRLKSVEIVTEEEIMTIVEEAEEDGTLKEEETELIRSVIEFDDLEVIDILVPRVNVIAVENTDSMEEIRKAFDEGYSRLPVYKDSIDTIIGTIHQKDFFNAYLDGKKDIKDILQKVYFTTEHVKISALLKQLQKRKIHIAVVLDEYGGTAGIVTMEDVLEQLVGEIWDEYDDVVRHIENIGKDVWVVEGEMPLSDYFEHFELDDEDENYEANTVSGWVVEYLGEIPRVGKKFEFNNLKIEILKSTNKLVLQIKTTVMQKKDED